MKLPQEIEWTVVASFADGSEASSYGSSNEAEARREECLRLDARSVRVFARRCN